MARDFEIFLSPLDKLMLIYMWAFVIRVSYHNAGLFVSEVYSLLSIHFNLLQYLHEVL